MQELSRDQHQVYCKDNKTVRVEMPKKGLTVEFYDGHNQFRVLFIMYADFEALLKPIDPKQKSPKESSTEGAVPTRHYTMSVNQHIPSGYCV